MSLKDVPTITIRQIIHEKKPPKSNASLALLANVANIVNIEHFFAWGGLSLLEPLIKQKGSM